MKRVRIRVYGRVQMVGFRWSARERAQRLGLTCEAKNEGDGSLTIVAEGEGRALDTFLAWCREGPPLAKVERVEVEEV